MGALSLLVFLPIAAILLLWALPGRFRRLILGLTIGVHVLQMVIFAVRVAPHYALGYIKTPAPFRQLRIYEQFDWIFLNLGQSGSLKIDFFLGLDGLNYLLVPLTLIISLIAVGASTRVDKRPKLYFILILLLNSALLGCFMALDFFLFYLFYELMLLPMFFLIGIWGGERREYASIKFFLYTLAGSVFMLAVMVGLAFSYQDPSTGAHTLNLLHLSNPANLVPDSVFAHYNARWWGFLAFFVALAVKLPVVPVHTWLPDAHVEASTPISVILAGVLLKVGGYGFFRLNAGIFPDVLIQSQHWLSFLAVLSIVYGGLNALAQNNLKKMIAYSSVSHMGFVLLGFAACNATGWNGAIFQMVSHGVISSGMFLLAGVLHDRVHSYRIDYFQGLWNKLPVFTGFVILIFFAAMGLPGLAAFVGEALTLAGSLSAAGKGALPYWVPVTAVLGILLSAAYLLWTLQRMFYGQFRVFGGEEWAAKLTDLNRAEWFTLAPLAVLIVVLGVAPAFALDAIDVSVARILESTLQFGQNLLNR